MHQQRSTPFVLQVRRHQHCFSVDRSESTSHICFDELSCFRYVIVSQVCQKFVREFIEGFGFLAGKEVKEAAVGNLGLHDRMSYPLLYELTICVFLQKERL